MTNLSSQLSRLRHDSSLHRDKKHTPSLLYSDKQAKSIDDVTIYHLACNGLLALTQLDAHVAPYADTLFSKESLRYNRMQCEATRVGEIDALVTCYLHTISPYFLLKSAQKTIEYLIRRYQIHRWNVDAIMEAFLWTHETPLFVTLVQLMPLTAWAKWDFLTKMQTGGEPLHRNALAKRCAVDQSLLKFIAESIEKVHVFNPKVYAFYTVVVLVILEQESVVSESLSRILLMYCINHLKSSASGDAVASSMLILSKLTTSVTLSEPVFHKVSKALVLSYVSSSNMDCLLCLVVLASTQTERQLSESVLKSVMKGSHFAQHLLTIAVDAPIRAWGITQPILGLCITAQNLAEQRTMYSTLLGAYPWTMEQLTWLLQHLQNSLTPTKKGVLAIGLKALHNTHTETFNTAASHLNDTSEPMWLAFLQKAMECPNAALTLQHPNLQLRLSAIDSVLNSKEDVDIVDHAALLCLRLEEEQSQTVTYLMHHENVDRFFNLVDLTMILTSASQALLRFEKDMKMVQHILEFILRASKMHSLEWSVCEEDHMLATLLPLVTSSQNVNVLSLVIDCMLPVHSRYTVAWASLLTTPETMTWMEVMTSLGNALAETKHVASSDWWTVIYNAQPTVALQLSWTVYQKTSAADRMETSLAWLTTTWENEFCTETSIVLTSNVLNIVQEMGAAVDEMALSKVLGLIFMSPLHVYTQCASTLTHILSSQSTSALQVLVDWMWQEESRSELVSDRVMHLLEALLSCGKSGDKAFAEVIYNHIWPLVMVQLDGGNKTSIARRRCLLSCLTSCAAKLPSTKKCDPLRHFLQQILMKREDLLMDPSTTVRREYALALSEGHLNSIRLPFLEASLSSKVATVWTKSLLDLALFALESGKWSGKSAFVKRLMTAVEEELEASTGTLSLVGSKMMASLLKCQNGPKESVPSAIVTLVLQYISRLHPKQHFSLLTSAWFAAVPSKLKGELLEVAVSSKTLPTAISRQWLVPLSIVQPWLTAAADRVVALEYVICQVPKQHLIDGCPHTMLWPIFMEWLPTFLQGATKTGMEYELVTLCTAMHHTLQATLLDTDDDDTAMTEETIKVMLHQMMSFASEHTLTPQVLQSFLRLWTAMIEVYPSPIVTSMVSLIEAWTTVKSGETNASSISFFAKSDDHSFHLASELLRTMIPAMLTLPETLQAPARLLQAVLAGYEQVQTSRRLPFFTMLFSNLGYATYLPSAVTQLLAMNQVTFAHEITLVATVTEQIELLVTMVNEVMEDSNAVDTLTFVTAHLSQPKLHRAIVEEEQDNLELEHAYLKLAEGLLLALRSHEASAFAALNTLESLLSAPSFIAVISELFTNEDPLIRRKALTMFNTRLQEARHELSPGEELLFVDMVDPIAELLVSEAESPANLQTACLSLDILARHFGTEGHHRKRFQKIVPVLWTLLQAKQEYTNVLTTVCICLSTVCQSIDVLSVQYIPQIVPFFITLLQKHSVNEDDVSDDTHILLQSVLTAILSLCNSKLLLFMHPYLPQLFTEWLRLESKFCPDSSELSLLLEQLWHATTTFVEIRTLLPALKNTFDLCKTESCVLPLFQRLQTFISQERMDSVSIQNNFQLLIQLFFQGFELRSVHGSEANIDNNWSQKEEWIMDSWMTLVMKLNEKQLKPVFLRLLEWSKKDTSRQIVFYRIVTNMCSLLKSIFVPYFSHFLEEASKKLSVSEEPSLENSEDGFFDQEPEAEEPDEEERPTKRQKTIFKTSSNIELSEWILKALNECFQYDNTGFMDKENLEVVLTPLVDQLDNTNDVDLIETIVECCGNLAWCLRGDDALWKPLHHAICMKTRSVKPTVRLSALKCVENCYRTVGEEFLVLLPETIPYLSELMEDDDSDVLSLCQKVVSRIETLSGESLDDYLIS